MTAGSELGVALARLNSRQAHLFFNSLSMNKNAQAVKHSIVQGNCLELMKKIPDNYIDFICADFPYNISGHAGLTMR